MALGPNLVHPATPGQPVPITWTYGFTQAYPSQHRRACLLTKGCQCLLLALIQHGLLPRCFFFFTFICQVPQNSSSYLSGTIFLNALKLKLSEPQGGKKNEYPLIMMIRLPTRQQMLLEYWIRKGNYRRKLECCQMSPTDKPLTVNSHLETQHDLVGETSKDPTKMYERWQRC